jgi:hypothetical protein
VYCDQKFLPASVADPDQHTHASKHHTLPDDLFGAKMRPMHVDFNLAVPAIKQVCQTNVHFSANCCLLAKDFGLVLKNVPLLALSERKETGRRKRWRMDCATIGG